MQIETIDCDYISARFAAVYLLRSDTGSNGEVAFVDANTALAVPKLLEALKIANRPPESVRYLLVTHVHLDHAGGAAALLKHCPNAQVLAHPRAVRHLVDPSRLEASARQVYGDAAFEELYGSKLEPIDPTRIRAVEDGETVSWNECEFQMLHTRGHANHHVCFYEKNSKVVFTGDSFGLCYPDLQLKGLFVLPSTSPTDFDAQAALETIDRIEALSPKAYYPTHFGMVEDVQGAAQQLRLDLAVSAQLVNDPTLSREGVLARLRTHYQARLEAMGFSLSPAQWGILDLDLKLNADGIHFAALKSSSNATSRARGP